MGQHLLLKSQWILSVSTCMARAGNKPQAGPCRIQSSQPHRVLRTRLPIVKAVNQQYRRVHPLDGGVGGRPFEVHAIPKTNVQHTLAHQQPSQRPAHHARNPLIGNSLKRRVGTFGNHCLKRRARSNRLDQNGRAKRFTQTENARNAPTSQPVNPFHNVARFKHAVALPFGCGEASHQPSSLTPSCAAMKTCSAEPPAPCATL